MTRTASREGGPGWILVRNEGPHAVTKSLHATASAQRGQVKHSVKHRVDSYAQHTPLSLSPKTGKSGCNRALTHVHSSATPAKWWNTLVVQ